MATTRFETTTDYQLLADSEEFTAQNTGNPDIYVKKADPQPTDDIGASWIKSGEVISSNLPAFSSGKIWVKTKKAQFGELSLTK